MRSAKRTPQLSGELADTSAGDARKVAGLRQRFAVKQRTARGGFDKLRMTALGIGRERGRGIET
jgi:hypothetical protein